MKKAGIITKMGRNYGAVLQAYAMRKALESAGCEAEIINYRHPASRAADRIFLPIQKRGSLRYDLKVLPHAAKIRKAAEKFNSFRREYFNLTEIYPDLESLRNHPPEDDIYFVGSDQVWNPSIEFSPIYFLDFGPDTVKRYSYAASFGKSTLKEEYKGKIKALLEKLDGISVREQSALSILDELSVSGRFVLDPTFLVPLSDWEAIEQKPEGTLPEHYIVCYFLNLNEAAERAVAKLKKDTGLPVINICSELFNPKIGDEERWDIGPREFIWLIHHADAVMTSSFHGTVFSILFEKKFLTVNVHKGDGRLTSLLETLNLSSHLLNDPENLCGINEPAVPGSEQRRLYEESMDYIMNAIR